jgi:hypothetical protein
MKTIAFAVERLSFSYTISFRRGKQDEQPCQERADITAVVGFIVIRSGMKNCKLNYNINSESSVLDIDKKWISLPDILLSVLGVFAKIRFRHRCEYEGERMGSQQVIDARPI